jgi:uncharacterized membrane protein
LDILVLLAKTILLRPYVFLFLAAFLISASRLLGWRRTGLFFLIAWITAFTCEFSSTRTGIPFGSYYYTGSTVGEELYLSNIPFMDSLSFTFLLYASYCLALLFLLPARASQSSKTGWIHLQFDLAGRTSWAVLLLAVLFYAFIDVVIDPVALRGDRWSLGQIYGYTYPGIYFGVPIENFIGWAVVGLIALSGYFYVDGRLPPLPPATGCPADPRVTEKILLGCGLYYGVLLFNLAMTFWIDEPLLGISGVLIYVPITALFILRLLGQFPAAIGPPR